LAVGVADRDREFQRIASPNPLDLDHSSSSHGGASLRRDI
jgi:hypothetical protein